MLQGMDLRIGLVKRKCLAPKHAAKFLAGFNHHVAEVMACSVAVPLCSQPEQVERQVRTTIDPPMAPEEAMKLLKGRGGDLDNWKSLAGFGRG